MKKQTKEKKLNIWLTLSMITIIPFIIYIFIKSIKYNKIKNKVENKIIIDTKLGFKENDLWNALGGKKNIASVKATFNKVSFELKDQSLVDLNKINKFPKSSGIIEGNNKISVIFGSISKTIESKFNNN